VSPSGIWSWVLLEGRLAGLAAVPVYTAARFLTSAGVNGRRYISDPACDEMSWHALLSRSCNSHKLQQRPRHVGCDRRCDVGNTQSRLILDCPRSDVVQRAQTEGVRPAQRDFSGLRGRRRPNTSPIRVQVLLRASATTRVGPKIHARRRGQPAAGSAAPPSCFPDEAPPEDEAHPTTTRHLKRSSRRLRSSCRHHRWTRCTPQPASEAKAMGRPGWLHLRPPCHHGQLRFRHEGQSTISAETGKKGTPGGQMTSLRHRNRFFVAENSMARSGHSTGLNVGAHVDPSS